MHIGINIGYRIWICFVFVISPLFAVYIAVLDRFIPDVFCFILIDEQS